MIPDCKVIVALNGSVKILDSYKVEKRKDMRKFISGIRSDFTGTAINTRSMFSLVNEWKAHNALYKAGIEPDRTESVDFEVKQSALLQIGYFVLSLMDNTVGILLLAAI